MKKRGHNDSDIQVMVQEFIDELRSMRYSDSCLNLYRRILCDFVRTVARAEWRVCTSVQRRQFAYVIGMQYFSEIVASTVANVFESARTMPSYH